MKPLLVINLPPKLRKEWKKKLEESDAKTNTEILKLFIKFAKEKGLVIGISRSKPIGGQDEENKIPGDSPLLN